MSEPSPNFTGLIKLFPEILHRTSKMASNQSKIQNLTTRFTPRAKILGNRALSSQKALPKKCRYGHATACAQAKGFHFFYYPRWV